VRDLRSNLVAVTSWLGLPDDYGNRLAGSIALSTSTYSPMCRGAQGVSNQGLPGMGVNACDYVGRDPIQHFGGIPQALAAPLNKFGDEMPSLPGQGDYALPNADRARSLLSLSQVATTRMGA
jgi:hypothetical protein